MPFERRFLTIAEAAAYLGIHPATAYEWAALDLLPIVRLGKKKRTIRVDKTKLCEKLEAQLSEQKRKPG